MPDAAAMLLLFITANKKLYNRGQSRIIAVFYKRCIVYCLLLHTTRWTKLICILGAKMCQIPDGWFQFFLCTQV